MLFAECSRIEKWIIVIKVWCDRQHDYVCRLMQRCTAANTVKWWCSKTVKQKFASLNRLTQPRKHIQLEKVAVALHCNLKAPRRLSCRFGLCVMLHSTYSTRLQPLCICWPQFRLRYRIADERRTLADILAMFSHVQKVLFQIFGHSDNALIFSDFRFPKREQ